MSTKHRIPTRPGRLGRTAIAAASALCLTSVVVNTVPQALSAPQGNVVAFGDSYTSNPDQIRNTLRFIPGITDGYPQTGGCLQAPNNWAVKVGEKTGLPVSNWSCAGNTSRGALGRIDAAIQSGDLHRGTRSVVLSVGMNNFGAFAVLDNVNILDPGAVRDAYLADMRTAADKIRSAAPGAKIIVSGTLPTVDRDSMFFCAVNVIPNMPGGLPIPVLRDVENWNRDNQRAAAQQIGAEYVEIVDPARGHDTCAPDLQRYVAGIVDTTTPDYNMAFHPSNAGSEFVADRVAAAV